MSDPSPIFLIGARGTGKSTVARLLAEHLGYDWVDADVLLEQRQGRSIRRIFAEEGEPTFRDHEEALLAELCSRTRTVIATGGGVVLRASNRQRLQQSGGAVIWLRAAVEILWRRLQGDPTTAERRPALLAPHDGPREIEELLRIRAPLYLECAQLTVDTGECAPAQVVAQIATWLASSGRLARTENGSR